MKYAMFCAAQSRQCSNVIHPRNPALPDEMGPILTSTGKLVRSFMRITSGQAYQLSDQLTNAPLHETPFVGRSVGRFFFSEIFLR